MFHLFPQHEVYYMWELALLSGSTEISFLLLLRANTPTQGCRPTRSHKEKIKKHALFPTHVHTHTHVSLTGKSTITVCRPLRLIPPVMDVTLCGAAKCVLEMCLELLCGTAECFGNEIITAWELL